jgi:hypothetical protein
MIMIQRDRRYRDPFAAITPEMILTWGVDPSTGELIYSSDADKIARSDFIVDQYAAVFASLSS